MSGAEDYVAGASNGPNGGGVESVEQLVTYAIGTRISVKVGTKLFRGAWDSCGKRWRPTGNPIDLGEEDVGVGLGEVLPIQAESPDLVAIDSLHFDYERLETVDPTTTETNDNGSPQTDDPDRPRPETQNNPDGGTGKLWTIIMESKMTEGAIKLRKPMEQKEAALTAELEEEKETRKQVEKDNENQMKSLWDALREAQ